MERAACRFDLFFCTCVTPAQPPIPHLGGVIAEGSPNVICEGQPMARMGDKVLCGGGPGFVMTGVDKVFVNGRPATRVLESISHQKSSQIATGAKKVWIGGPSILPGNAAAGIRACKAAAGGRPNSPRNKKKQSYDMN